MAEKKNFYDEVNELRNGFGALGDKPEFPSAVGGYSRAEVNRYIAEQSAAAEKMKRVFYDKNQELRDEMQLLAEENRALRAASESFVPNVVINAANEKPGEDHADATDMRKLVEQVAAVLKGRHGAELRARDERIESMKAAYARDKQALEQMLADARSRVIDTEALKKELAAAKALETQVMALQDELAAAKALETQVETLKNELSQRDERLNSFARVLAGNDAKIAQLTHELEQAKASGAQVEALKNELSQRDERTNSFARAFADNDAKIAQLTHELEQAKALEAQVEALKNELSQRDERINSFARVFADNDAKIALLTHELEQAKASGSASPEELKKKDDEIASLADKVAEREVEIRRGDLTITRLNATLLEKDCELAKLRAGINEIAKLNGTASADSAQDARHESQYRDKEHGKIISPRFANNG